MSLIRLVQKSVIVAALVVGLSFAGALRPAPAKADAATDAIIASCAFVAYLAVVGGLTWLLYARSEKEKPQQPRRDPYSFTSDGLPKPATEDGLRFGAKCAVHGPGTLFCW
jgi:hypothetical protein